VHCALVRFLSTLFGKHAYVNLEKVTGHMLHCAVSSLNLVTKGGTEDLEYPTPEIYFLLTKARFLQEQSLTTRGIE